jgi:hypothetical protein
VGRAIRHPLSQPPVFSQWLTLPLAKLRLIFGIYRTYLAQNAFLAHSLHSLSPTSHEGAAFRAWDAQKKPPFAPQILTYVSGSNRKCDPGRFLSYDRARAADGSAEDPFLETVNVPGGGLQSGTFHLLVLRIFVTPFPSFRLFLPVHSMVVRV